MGKYTDEGFEFDDGTLVHKPEDGEIRVVDLDGNTMDVYREGSMEYSEWKAKFDAKFDAERGGLTIAQAELKAAPFLVLVQSEEYGNEFFKRDTIEDAMTTIRSIATEVKANPDGVERIIGLVINPLEYGILDGLE